MSLGFSKMEAMIRIIIPQAVKNILPVIGNEFVTLIKESSQVSVIGMADLMYTATTVQGISFQPFPPLVIVAAYYFVITFSVSTLLRLMEKKMNIKSARES
jgi:ABC-type amino acid transport system permease subunit